MVRRQEAHRDVEVERELERVHLGALVWREVDELGGVGERLVVPCGGGAEVAALEQLRALLLILGHQPEPVGVLELARVVVVVLAVGRALGGGGGGGGLERALLLGLVRLDRLTEGDRDGVDLRFERVELGAKRFDVGGVRLREGARGVRVTVKVKVGRS